MTERRCGTCAFQGSLAGRQLYTCDAPLPECLPVSVLDRRELMFENEGTDCAAWKEKTDAVHADYVLTPPVDPQPASNPCALPEDAAAAKEALGG